MQRYTTDQMLRDFSILREVCGRHGVGVPRNFPADVQHLVSPLVGMLRLDGPEAFFADQGKYAEYFLERLSLLLALGEMVTEGKIDAFVEDFDNFLKNERN